MSAARLSLMGRISQALAVLTALVVLTQMPAVLSVLSAAAASNQNCADNAECTIHGNGVYYPIEVSFDRSDRISVNHNHNASIGFFPERDDISSIAPLSGVSNARDYGGDVPDEPGGTGGDPAETESFNGGGRGRGLSSGPSRLANWVAPSTACDWMATTAQKMADGALTAHRGSGHRIDYQAALVQFDHEYSVLYTGAPMRNTAVAIQLALDQGNGRLVEQGSPYWGQTGFRPEFMDTDPRSIGKLPTEIDQTHHFAAYLSAGINGLLLEARLHAARDNSGDAALGRTAFALGAQLAADPVQLAHIGEMVSKHICAP